jgi:hypothetical protein
VGVAKALTVKAVETRRSLEELVPCPKNAPRVLVLSVRRVVKVPVAVVRARRRRVLSARLELTARVDQSVLVLPARHQ